ESHKGGATTIPRSLTCSAGCALWATSGAVPDSVWITVGTRQTIPAAKVAARRRQTFLFMVLPLVGLLTHGTSLL
ncbi:MAG TPA: hypothetical protein VFT59_00790, partial [Candidatus Saccharimonadales bacterium]|nr:hypothetical protein [Candidatus Saccharimonadales bacterium]